MTYQVKIMTKNGLETIQLATLQTALLQQSAAIQYELINSETKAAPQSISVRRVGNDLEIAIEDSAFSNLTIEGYYSSQSLSPIVGRGEDGQLYHYSADGENSIATLNEGAIAIEVLSEHLFVSPSFVNHGSSTWLAAGISLGTLGVIVIPKTENPAANNESEHTENESEAENNTAFHASEAMLLQPDEEMSYGDNQYANSAEDYYITPLSMEIIG